MHKRVSILVFIILWVNNCASQSNFFIAVSKKGSSKLIDTRLRVNNISNAKKQAILDLNNYRINGYFTASLDSVIVKQKKYIAYIYLGKLFKIGTIKFKDFDSLYQRKMGFKKLSSKSINKAENYKKWAYNALEFAENNGYAFAQITFDSISTNGKEINCIAQLDKGNLYNFDTISLGGNNILNKKFLYQYLDIKPGTIYNENLFKSVSKKLQSLAFVRLIREPTMLFTNTNKAVLILSLGKKNVDMADGFIGFAPVRDKITNTNRIKLSGQFDLKLNNLFKSAKSFELHWRSFQPSSQQLKTHFKVPYMLKSKLGLGAGFNFIKQAEEFLTTQINIEPFVMLAGNNTFTLKYIRRSSISIDIDTNFIKINKQLPSNTPFASTAYGMGLYLNKTNSVINPKSGYIVQLNTEVEVKKLKEHVTIKNVILTNLNGQKYNAYDSAVLRNLQYRYSYNIAYYIPIGKQNIIGIKTDGFRVFSPKIYQSELRRIGGNKELKGFDDNSIFASAFDLLTIEYKYLLQSESYISIFANGARVENRTYPKSLPIDYPIGIGFGTGLSTGNGMLNIALAVGKNNHTQFDISQTKIHFGFINYF